jgi:hypothetical protein
VKSDVMAKRKRKNDVMVISAVSCIHTLPVLRYDLRFKGHYSLRKVGVQIPRKTRQEAAPKRL